MHGFKITKRSVNDLIEMIAICGLKIIHKDDGTVHTQISRRNMPVEIIAMQLRSVLNELDENYDRQARANITIVP